MNTVLGQYSSRSHCSHHSHFREQKYFPQYRRCRSVWVIVLVTAGWDYHWSVDFDPDPEVYFPNLMDSTTYRSLFADLLNRDLLNYLTYLKRSSSRYC